jgi:chromosome segregation ATPase
MELDELEKRLEWLDSERQKSNLELKTVKDHVVGLETIIDKQKQAISSLEKELKVMSVINARVVQFDNVLEQVKIDIQKQISDLEKKQNPLLKALEKQEKEDQNTFNKRINEVQAVLPIITEIRKNLQNRIDEENRLSQRIETLNNSFENVNSSISLVTQEKKRVVDDLQLNNKRMSDMQVEINTLRKRVEEERNRSDLNVELLQKLETNLKMVLVQEAERKQSQIAFIEKTSLVQVERENIWKSWQGEMKTIDALSSDFTQKISALEATHKAIKLSQKELDDVNLRFDRRINELTEMHRLNEERFRQEWLSFKSDDQKRWTNYQLTQEEQQQDDSRHLGKITDRITTLEDEVQAAKEAITLINEEIDKQLKSFYSLFHDLIESFDQTFSSK